MCGHVGFIGKDTTVHKAAFHDLLQWDVVRGLDATGVAMIAAPMEEGKHQHPHAVHKDAVLPQQLMRRNTYKNDAGLKRQAFIGHNRWATKGEINSTNAHPFVKKSIIGAHNGTVHEHQITKLPNIKGKNPYPTDSEALIDSIANHGPADTWAALNGAAALVWWDDTNSTINIVRNKERPMSYAYTKDRTAVFWSSEAVFLEVIEARHAIDLDTIMTINPHWLHTFVFNDIVVHQATELKPYVAPPYVAPVFTQPYQSSFGFGSEKVWDKDKQKFVERQKKDTSVVPFHCSPLANLRQQRKIEKRIQKAKGEIKNGNRRTFNDVFCNHRTFSNSYKTCLACGDVLLFEDHDIEFLSNSTALCGVCGDYARYLQYYQYAQPTWNDGDTDAL